MHARSGAGSPVDRSRHGGARRRGAESGSLRHRVGVGALALLLVAAAVYAGLASSPSDSAAGDRKVIVSPAPGGPGLDVSPQKQAPRVLAAEVASDTTRRARVERLIADAVDDRSQLGRHVGAAVAELGGGEVWRLGVPDPVTPASTLKLLTATAALEELGAEHRFTTTVVRPTRGSVVLVGGGDPLLTDLRQERPPEVSKRYPPAATLQDLAEQTAQRLRSDGVRQVRLQYDDSLFTGPAVNPAWEPSYIPDSVVSPITALWVDEGRQIDDYDLRVADPAREAADRFSVQLQRQGVRVRGRPAPASARADADMVAEVRSPMLSQVVEHVLQTSDNEGAEVLLRHVALAQDRPGSSAAGVTAVQRVLDRLGLDTSQLSMDDGSGLARTNELTVGLLVEVLQLAAWGDHPDLRTVAAGLPVAGFSGSLDGRFVDVAPDGLGLVRAKTGTLTGVHALAGVVSTKDDEVLAFAVVADRVPVVKTLAARAQLERITALLATCGC